MQEPITETAANARKRNNLVRRTAPERSQKIRRIVQWSFIALNAALALQFYLWVRFYETGGSGWLPSRPAGVDGWLPIAGLMNTKYFLTTGSVSAVHPAAMFIFLAFVLMSVFAKKAFCSWLCPVGTLSEYLAKFGAKIWGRNFHLPRWADIPLRGLKYLLLLFFASVIAFMSADALDSFMQSPYGLLADVKMLNFFRGMSATAAIVLLILAALSTLVQNFWCRYLCPYGALLGLVSLLSPIKIRRDEEACIDCAKCARACPAALPVDKLLQIRSAECAACMQCVAVCPAQNALQFALPPRKSAEPAQRWYRRALGPAAVVCMLAYFFLGMVLLARVSGHWQTNIPQAVYRQLVPNSKQLSHPGL